MKKIILRINGMGCGMCESHINDIIRKNFNIKKVKSSYKKRMAVIIPKDDLNLEFLKATINKTGYIVEEITFE